MGRVGRALSGRSEQEECAVGSLITAIHALFSVYSLVIILRSFLGMFIDPLHPVAVFIRRITEPLLAPIRRVVPPIQAGGALVDLSPMVALVLLWAVERILVVVLSSLAR